MFTTPEKVLRVSGKEVTAEQIYTAQFIIETWIGRSEAEVKTSRDKGILERASIAQVVYMLDNYDQVWQQIAAAQITNNDTNIVFKAGDSSSPWIAPLAVINCAQLSWFKSRSVRTGRTLQHKVGSFKEMWMRD